MAPWNTDAGIIGIPRVISLTKKGTIVMEKQRLFDRLFGFEDEDVGLNAIELYVGRLRRKLAGSGVIIKTLRGLGYQLLLDEGSA